MRATTPTEDRGPLGHTWVQDQLHGHEASWSLVLRKALLDLIFFLHLRFLIIFEKEAHIFILRWAL